MIVCKS